MGGFRDKLRGMIFEEHDTPTPATPIDKSKGSHAAPVIPTAPATPAPQSSGFNAAGEVDPQFLEMLTSEVNRDTEPALTKFLALLTSLSGIIPEESTRFQAAMVSAQQQGIDMPKLIAAAEGRLKLLDRETGEFEDELKEKEGRDVGQKQEILRQTEEHITSLQQQIADMEARKDALQQEISSATDKMATARQRFDSACQAMRRKFQTELGLIKKYANPGGN